MHTIDYAQVSKYLKGNKVVTDSRKVTAGDLFVALKGEKYDGHNFIEAAVAKGASCVIASEAVSPSLPVTVIEVKNTLIAYGQLAAMHKECFKVPTVAITGSCGKTTTREMLNSILSRSGKVLASYGNHNNEIGVPSTLLSLNSSYDYAIVEMGARKPGDIAYLMGIVKPDVAVVTNVGPSHLATLHSKDKVAEVKGEIYQYLSPHGKAVLNADDVYYKTWLDKLDGQSVLSFGLETMADITCAFLSQDVASSLFELVTDIGTIQIKLPVAGYHNVLNALAAVGCARSLDCLLPEIRDGLMQYSAVARRLEIKESAIPGIKVIDDTYNANPLSTKMAVSTLMQFAGKKILVLGDMLELGEVAKQEHVSIGKYAKQSGVDYLLGFGEFMGLAVEAFGEHGRHYNDKQVLLEDLFKLISQGSVVLVKGSNNMHMDEVADILVSGG